MNIDFPDIMSKKSDEVLQKYLDDISKLMPEAVEAAFNELQKRGRAFSEAEIANFNIELKKRRDAIGKEDDDFFKSANEWNNSIVTDVEAPQYYSQKTIFIFSIAFSVLFGSVLLAINLRKTQSKRGIVPVVVFGIIYTVLQIFVLQESLRNPLLVLILSSGGAIILYKLFWIKYIGKDIKYREKPILTPLIVGIIEILIIWALIYFTPLLC